jgi:hypothetical protein
MLEDKLDDQISSQESSNLITSSLSNTDGKSNIVTEIQGEEN